MMRAIFIGLLTTALSGCLSFPTANELLSLTPEHFRDTATVTDDDLEILATITTEQGFIDIAGGDGFLRDFINKKTGRTNYQVYERLWYGGEWRYYETVNYQTPTGPVSAPLTIIDRSVDCTDDCTFREHVGFDIGERFLRDRAAEYIGVSQKPWLYKLKAHSGDEFPDGLMPAEIAGLLMAVDAYRAAHHLPIPRP